MAKSAFDPVFDKADRTVGSARETARHARDTVDEGYRAFPELARTAQKAFSDGVDQLRGRAGDAADDAGEQFDTARLYLVERVQERPFTATLAALGAGFILGLLFFGGRR
jgi:ElaB/YqjD/DUF883 family membrane-anchored ribosome-binding protein